MQIKDIEKIISQFLSPMNFKKKKRTWILIGDEITEIISLQKSSFGNNCYLHHDYIVNNIPLDGLPCHTSECWYMVNVDEISTLNSLLDLDNNITDEERKKLLYDYLTKRFTKYVGIVNTEKKFREIMENQPALSRKVQEYFKIGVYSEKNGVC